MQPVICHTIIIIVHTVRRKEEIVVKNAKSGLNLFGDLFPTQSTFLGASPSYSILLDLHMPPLPHYTYMHLYIHIQDKRVFHRSLPSQ